MDAKLKEILSDNISGSTSFTRHALDYFKSIIEATKPDDHSIGQSYQRYQNAVKALTKAQPNMALVRRSSNMLVSHYKRLLKQEKPAAEIIAEISTKIDDMQEEITRNIHTIAASSSKIISNFNKIMTISNSTIVRMALEMAETQKKKIEVYCLKSHPPDEGVILAEELARKGIKVTLLSDAGAAFFLPEINLVLIGADRLYETGFINKAGTFSLCLTAGYFHVPVYLAVETAKILKESERAIKTRYADPGEIYSGKVRNLQAENVYFEQIPFKLVTKVMCEEGVFETHEFIRWNLGE